MKKIIVALALMVSMIGAVSAQVEGKAIGIRFGYGGEISYQHPMGDANRLEFDLGYNYFGTNKVGVVSEGLSLNGVYQWVWDLSELADGFNWYAGFGGAVISHSTFFGVGALGQVGIEYNFNIPLQLSLDARPAFYILPGTDKALRPSYYSACLSARYRF